MKRSLFQLIEWIDFSLLISIFAILTTVLSVYLFIYLQRYKQVIEKIQNSHKEDLQLEVLEEFGRILKSPMDIKNMVEFIVAKMKQVTGCSYVYFYEGDSFDTVKLLNLEEEITLTPFSPIWIAQTYREKKLIEGDSFICIPLTINRKIIGVLRLIFPAGFNIGQKQRALMEKISINIATLLKVYKLILESNRQRDLNESMYKFGLVLQTIKSDQEVSTQLLSDVKKMTDFDFIVYRSQNNRYSIWDCVVGNTYPMEYFKPEGDILEYSLQWGRTIAIENAKDKKELEFESRMLIDHEQLNTVLSIPLIYNNKILGAMMFGSRKIKVLSEESQQLIRTLINMIAVQVENKNLYARMENDATILERQRISREIHDGLAQNIGFITIQMHRLKKLIEKNQIAKAIQEIDVIQQAVDESYMELRETLDQLRDLTGYKENLCDWLHKYSREFEQSHRIKVSFDVIHMDKIRLNVNQVIQITRVIQEVLNNIRKHAMASEIKMTLSGGSQLSLIIEDNGIGFDVTALKKSKCGGHGLPILEERMRSINGFVHIDSKPNQGTKVQIEVPIPEGSYT